MADDRWYNPGDNYLLDDFSGFKIRASRSARVPGGQTGGAQVDVKRWEPQQPQDFVRGVADDQQPAILRPRQANRFVVVGTSVSAFSPAQSTSLQVYSTEGFVVGAICQVPLDNGNLFNFTLTGIGSDELIFLGQPLPWGVGGSFADPLQNSVLQIAGAGAFDQVFVLNVAGRDILNFNVLG